MRWHRKQRDLSPLRPNEKHNRPKPRVLPQLEALEARTLLSASSATNEVVLPLQVMPQQSSAISGYTPQQIQQAYGVNSLLDNGTNGKGETIAIVDAYNDPNIINDVKTFDTQFGLQQFNVSGGPTLKVAAPGGGSASSLSQNADWALETSLDVEWAHTVAPQANILLVEAPDATDTSLISAVQYAASQPGVVAVSMSWGENEFSDETSDDSYFVPPKSNPGVTFVAASGDNGSSGAPLYPATSPYVLAVGGTTLHTTTNSSGGAVYSSESAWSGSGGGYAAYEGEPSYQYSQSSIDNTYGYPNVNVTNWLTGATTSSYSRMTPDVAYNADPNTGYAVYDSTPSLDYGFSGGWTEVGGTSAAAPQWSALIALADQQRAAVGEKPLDTNQVQNQLYNSLSNGNYANVFHDITTGNNGGYSAGTGYDPATGLGTPVANNLVPYLASTTIPLGQLPTIQGSGNGGASTTLFGWLFGSGGFLAASAQPGAGLYTGSGSLSIPSGFTGANGQSGQTGGAPLATLVTFSISTVTFSISPTGAGTASTPSAASTNALVAQSNSVFGGSGWNGSALSWRLTRLDLPTRQVEQLANNLAENLKDASDSSADSVILADAATSWKDPSALDVTVPVLHDR